jgi:hypothetical protein
MQEILLDIVVAELETSISEKEAKEDKTKPYAT